MSSMIRTESQRALRLPAAALVAVGALSLLLLAGCPDQRVPPAELPDPPATVDAGTYVAAMGTQAAIGSDGAEGDDAARYGIDAALVADGTDPVSVARSFLAAIRAGQTHPGALAAIRAAVRPDPLWQYDNPNGEWPIDDTGSLWPRIGALLADPEAEWRWSDLRAWIWRFDAVGPAESQGAFRIVYTQPVAGRNWHAVVELERAREPIDESGSRPWQITGLDIQATNSDARDAAPGSTGAGRTTQPADAWPGVPEAIDLAERAITPPSRGVILSWLTRDPQTVDSRLDLTTWQRSIPAGRLAWLEADGSVEAAYNRVIARLADGLEGLAATRPSRDAFESWITSEYRGWILERAWIPLPDGVPTLDLRICFGTTGPGTSIRTIWRYLYDRWHLVDIPLADRVVDNTPAPWPRIAGQQIPLDTAGE